MSAANALIQRLVPKDKRFFPLFDEFGSIVLKASETYGRLLRSSDPLSHKSLVDEIEKYEHRGDELIHKIVTELTATFITPFDREDIHRLASTLDGVLDDILAGARRIVLYEVHTVPAQLVILGNQIESSGKIAAECLSHLKSIRNPKDFAQKIRDLQINKSNADEVFLQGVAALYAAQPNSTEVLKLREIYYATMDALKYFHELSFALEAILIKTT
jgi:uncharacterized protein Yka (UPF0111/DUF47 family)